MLKKNCTLCCLLFCRVLFTMRKFVFVNLPCLNVDLLGRGTASAELPADPSERHLCCWVVQRIISRALQLLSSTHYQNSTWAVNFFVEISERHINCWGLKRRIRAGLQLQSYSANYQNSTSVAPSIFTSSSVLRIPSRPSCLSTWRKHRQQCPSCFMPLCSKAHTVFFGCMLHSVHPWVFPSSECNLSSSEP